MPSPDVYAERRRRVLEAITPGVLIVPAAPVAIRNGDVEHDYRQDSDFYYLTGLDEPDSVLVLSSSGEHPFVLFVRPRDPEREVWDGPRIGCEGALDRYGAQAAYPVAEFPAKLPDLLQNRRRLYYRLGRDRGFDDRVLAAVDTARARARRGPLYPTEIVDPATVLHEMRRIKAPEEIELMERAAGITREAHLAAMDAARPGMYEYEVEALLFAIFRKRGAERTAYGSIVGSGPNATVLHYRRNDRRMEEGELLLIDAGCEYGYYASDVTRTFPVGGRFSEAQRKLYEVVLEAQEAGIRATRPGASLEDVHQASVRVMAEGFVRLGLLTGPIEEVLAEERYKTYFMHKTSHYLGMDVHDVGGYFVEGRPRLLEPGVVITVEPGAYVAVDAQSVPPEYRGLGIRIEDDVLVTEQGHRVLSAGIPKSIREVELACGK